MKIILLVATITSCAVTSFAQHINNTIKKVVVAKGRMPNVTTDKNNNVHVVYGTGDSIMYLYSSNKGQSFTTPSLVAVLPGLFASAMRGPQIATTGNGIVVTACTNKGNIYSYKKQHAKGWANAIKVNEEDEVAKEALIGLSADGSRVFAVWLAAKKSKGQTISGASSADGGLTWNNLLVYASPESTVCECCKPSVVVKGNTVHVMFRNFLNGNRDMYLSKSVNGGKSFNEVQKLGVGSWKLNGCPMDGGGLAIDTKVIHTQCGGVRERYMPQPLKHLRSKLAREKVVQWNWLITRKFIAGPKMVISS